MSNWVPVAVALVAIAAQILVGAEQGAPVGGCPPHVFAATGAPPDFLFATAEEWKWYALELELDRLR